MDRDLLPRRLRPFTVASLFFALMAALWATAMLGPYYRIISAWGVDPHNAPFLDTDMILSAVRCRQAGIDVYISNPCDQLGRVYDYSPFWLIIAHVPGLGLWLTPIGLGCDMLFLGALPWLPPGRTRRAATLIAAGAISSAALFAMERGNNDLIIFALIVLAAELSVRSRHVRLVGYGAALFAGLLKYYPMTVLAIATRESPRRLFAIAATAAVVLAAYVEIMGHDLVRALALIPTGDYISDMFGASTFAGGLYSTFSTTKAPGRLVLQATMTLAALAIAAWQGTRPALATDLGTLDERERTFLLAGAMLMLGCFFTAQNIGYRAIHFILVLPALTALRQSAPGKVRYTWTIVAALLLLWAQGWQTLVHSASTYLAPGAGFALEFAAWSLREALWWWTITMLGSLAVALLSVSDAAGSLLARLRGRPKRAVAI